MTAKVPIPERNALSAALGRLHWLHPQEVQEHHYDLRYNSSMAPIMKCVKRQCAKCKKRKPFTVKYWYPCTIRNKGSWCKGCNRESAKARRKKPEVALRFRIRRSQRVKEWLTAYKATQKCKECGESRIPCLQFHHRDPSTKKFMINQSHARHTITAIKREIAKCDVLCANCHLILHGDDTA